MTKQELWDIEDVTRYRDKVRALNRAIVEAEERERASRSKYALDRRETKEARLRLSAFLEEDAKPLGPLFDGPHANGDGDGEVAAWNGRVLAEDARRERGVMEAPPASEPPPSEPKQGWAFTARADKAHYFRAGVSVCRTGWFHAGEVGERPTAKSSCCAECLRKCWDAPAAALPTNNLVGPGDDEPSRLNAPPAKPKKEKALAPKPAPATMAGAAAANRAGQAAGLLPGVALDSWGGVISADVAAREASEWERDVRAPADEAMKAASGPELIELHAGAVRVTGHVVTVPKGLAMKSTLMCAKPLWTESNPWRLYPSREAAVSQLVASAQRFCLIIAQDGGPNRKHAEKVMGQALKLLPEGPEPADKPLAEMSGPELEEACAATEKKLRKRKAGAK